MTNKTSGPSNRGNFNIPSMKSKGRSKVQEAITKSNNKGFIDTTTGRVVTGAMLIGTTLFGLHQCTSEDVAKQQKAPIIQNKGQTKKNNTNPKIDPKTKTDNNIEISKINQPTNDGNNDKVKVISEKDLDQAISNANIQYIKETSDGTIIFELVHDGESLTIGINNNSKPATISAKNADGEEVTFERTNFELPNSVQKALDKKSQNWINNGKPVRKRVLLQRFETGEISNLKDNVTTLNFTLKADGQTLDIEIKQDRDSGYWKFRAEEKLDNGRPGRIGEYVKPLYDYNLSDNIFKAIEASKTQTKKAQGTKDKFVNAFNNAQVIEAKLIRDKVGEKKEYGAVIELQNGQRFFVIAQAYQDDAPRDTNQTKIDYIKLNKKQASQAMTYMQQLAMFVSPKRVKKDMYKYFKKTGLGEMKRTTKGTDDLQPWIQNMTKVINK